MAEAVALSLATDAATGIGQLLMGRTIEEMKLVWGLKDDLEKLKTKFSKLQLFLKDVESAKHAEKRSQVNDWLLRVKDAGYVADDIIDDYDYEVIRREREQKKQLRTFFSRNNNPILFRISMSHRVRDALASFDELDKEARDMGLRQVEITKDGIAGTSANNDQGTDRLSQIRQYASANAAQFVGRKDEMKELLEILCRPRDNQEGDISTVAIRGIGGIGKTTFAKCLYNSKDIDAHFEKKFWISVSDNFTISRILKEMLESVPSKDRNISNTDAIIKQLRDNLKNKKYLLVLDDVWCKDQELWSFLKNALHRIGGLPGCLILITTRLIEVTTRSQAVYTHLLRELSEEEGWALLKQCVSAGGTSPNFSSLEEIGKKIVEKCKGVPLAIKAIGGILQSMQLPREWELIEKSEIWDLPQNDENQILPSLRLTFDHLPYPSLKQCFAYCPAFCPRGYTVEKDELVSIWLAQGFLDGSEIKDHQKIGEKYLMVLLNYSLLDEVKGGPLQYKMHDLVYDLAVDVSGKDLFFLKPKDHQKIDSCRHLVIRDVEALSKLPITKTLRKLRTISNGLPHNVLAQAKYLRTLSVDRCGIKELPSSIGLLKHLRFLSLSNNPIETLPDSIGKLYLLQTLRLLDCYYMNVLPAILNRLTNLIHVPTTASMLASRGLGELTNLHTLPRLELGDDEDGLSIDELGGLQKLTGEIHISGLEHVKTKENARKADLAGKAKVSNITLAWDPYRYGDENYDKDVLDGLQPHPNIISLELQNFFGLTFPSWIVRMAVVSEGGSPLPLNNLTSLKLLNCSRCYVLPPLGHLPCLKYLVLSGLRVDSIGNDFYSVPLNKSNNKVNRVSFDSFPSLTELEISDFKSLKTWLLPSTGEETVLFPRLEVIKVTNCPQLETIPAFEFPSLKTLQLVKVGIQSLDIMKQNPSCMLSPEVNIMLETLEVEECEKLVCLPRELQFVASLKTLKVHGCVALTSLPNDLFHGLTSLSELCIMRCEALTNIPASLEKCASLATLTIYNCPSIKGPTPDFSKLKGLQKMTKGGNPIELMISMLKAVEQLPNLTGLQTGKFKDEVEQDLYFSDVSPFQQNQSVRNFYLQGQSNIKSLPEQLQLLTEIKRLTIYYFDDLEVLPEWVGRLSSLEVLALVQCKNLKDIPSKEVFLQMTQLRKLHILMCPILAESCAKDDGSDWNKISHVPFIEIDSKEIQSMK